MEGKNRIVSWSSRVAIVISSVLVLHAGGNAEVSTTPPMGWNSYDALNHSVTEQQVKDAADFMAENLKEYGWEYICIDWAWYFTGNLTGSPNQDGNFNPRVVVDEYGRMLPDPGKFPSSTGGKGLKPLADYVHSKGLKLGVHLMRGIPRQTVAANTPVKGSNAKANDIVDRVNLCAWLNLMFGLDMNKNGAQEYYNSLFELYASWGIDYVKVDDLINPYGSPAFRGPEIEGYRKAIDNCGRDMVFSTSPGATPVSDAGKIKDLANQWRIVNDLWDNWKHLNNIFDVSYDWYPHAGPGHWPDADMIPIGRLNKHGPTGSERWSNLTSVEKHTMMSLWCIVQSPLIWGGNLVENRAEELELMQNSEVMAVNQKAANARPIVNGNTPVWCSDIPGTGDHYVAMFNRNSGTSNVTVNFSDIGIPANDTVTVRDLWAKADKGKFNGSYRASIPSHGSVLLRVIGKEPEKISAFEKNVAVDYNTQSGTRDGECSEGGEKVGYVEHRDYTVYANVDFGDDGADGFEARVAGYNDGVLEVRLDSLTAEPIASCEVEGTEDWDDWKTVSCSLSVVTGIHDVYLVFTGGDDFLFDVSWYRFTASVVGVDRAPGRPVGMRRYRTAVSNGLLTVTPDNFSDQYNISVYAPDGRLVIRKKGVTGRVDLPVECKGVYVVRITGSGSMVEKQIIR